MHTHLVHQLDIDNLNAQLMKGSVNLGGVVSWKDHVTWDVQGRLDKINPKDDVLPQVVSDFLPPSLDAKIASKGTLEKGLHLTADLDFDRYEAWHLALDQNPEKNNKVQPMLMDVSWKNIDRAVPYIGWLSSASGDVKLALVEGQQDIHVATVVSQHEKATLPAGNYLAQLNFKNNNLNVPSFSYVAGKGSLSGNAVVELPDEKRQLKWKAALNAKDFNPQMVAEASPVNLLNGKLQAKWLCQTESANHSATGH